MRPIHEFLKEPAQPCAIVAHRGAWHFGPENSISAINAAADNGYTFVELDVQKSWDDTFFCLHDRTLNRMTNADGYAAGRPWEELAALSLMDADGRDALLTAEPLPSLEAALEAARDRVYLDIDTKFPDQIEAVARVIKAAGMRDQVNLKRELCCRADYETLRGLEDSTGFLVKPILFADPASLTQIKSLIAEAKFPLIELLCPDLETILAIAKDCHAVGTEVFVNTLDEVPSCPAKDSAALIDPDGTWGALIRSHIRLIQTDEPEALAQYINGS